MSGVEQIEAAAAHRIISRLKVGDPPLEHLRNPFLGVIARLAISRKNSARSQRSACLK